MKKGFIDTDMANRGAKGGSSEGANKTRQSVRNNQVITGARSKATSPVVPPLVRPTPPPAPPATDTSAPGNAAANIAAAIATRPSPPVVVGKHHHQISSTKSTTSANRFYTTINSRCAINELHLDTITVANVGTKWTDGGSKIHHQDHQAEESISKSVHITIRSS